MLRRALVAGSMLLVLSTIGVGEEASAGFNTLFNGKDLTGWKTFLDPKSPGADPNVVWTIKGGQIYCTGKPFGYLLTDEEYGNYVLRVEWRWPEKPGNSGVFLHVSGPDKIWPKGVEAQLESGSAGDFWLVDGFKLTVPDSDGRQDPRSPRHFLRIGESWKKLDAKDSRGRDKYEAMRKQFEKPVGQWNQYEITCRGDTIDLVVNGQHVNSGTHAEASKGRILLQSEGAPVVFGTL